MTPQEQGGVSATIQQSLGPVSWHDPSSPGSALCSAAQRRPRPAEPLRRPFRAGSRCPAGSPRNNPDPFDVLHGEAWCWSCPAPRRALCSQCPTVRVHLQYPIHFPQPELRLFVGLAEFNGYITTDNPACCGISPLPRERWPPRFGPRREPEQPARHADEHKQQADPACECGTTVHGLVLARPSVGKDNDHNSRLFCRTPHNTVAVPSRVIDG